MFDLSLTGSKRSYKVKNAADSDRLFETQYRWDCPPLCSQHYSSFLRPRRGGFVLRLFQPTIILYYINFVYWFDNGFFHLLNTNL